MRNFRNLVRRGIKTILRRVTAPRNLVSGRKLFACERSDEAIFKLPEARRNDK